MRERETRAEVVIYILEKVKKKKKKKKKRNVGEPPCHTVVLLDLDWMAPPYTVIGI